MRESVNKLTMEWQKEIVSVYVCLCQSMPENANWYPPQSSATWWGGTVIAQQWRSFGFTAAFLRNTTSESLSSELFELDADVFVLAFCFYNTPSCSTADFRDSEPPKPTRVPNASSNCRVNPLGLNCQYITFPYDIHGCPACFGLSSPTQCWIWPFNNLSSY